MWLAVLVNFSGLFVPLISPDATLYATLSKTMVQTGDFIGLYANGKDWLDKPHLPFWITAFSFKLFGFHGWSYKLPGILFLLMGVRYTYLLAKEFYPEETALWSAIILLTAQHIVISNNDVRAEPYLTGFIVGSVYHFYKALGRRWGMQLLFGSLLAAAAVMTKGIFALVPIGGAIAGGLVAEKRGNELFSPKWLLAFVLTALFILPELWCLWYQFDHHPEKVVFGRTGVSGLRFFFWDSQFGRFTNTGPIKGQGDVFFFFHTILWAFLPWSLLLYAAVVRKLKALFKKKEPVKGEWFTLTGAGLTLLLFSFSGFQLPYYTNILFPFFAILTSHFIGSTTLRKTKRTIGGVQVFVAVLYFALGTVIPVFFRPPGGYIWLLFLAAAGMFIFVTMKIKNAPYLWKVSVLAVAATVPLNLFLNVCFYPALLKYQAGSEAAFYLNKNFNGQPVASCIENPPYDLAFYVNGPCVTGSPETLQHAGLPARLLFISRADSGKVSLPFRVLKSFPGFPVSRLDWTFFNADTRAGELKEYWLIKI